METIEIEVTEVKFPKPGGEFSGFTVFTFSNSAGLTGMAKGKMHHIPEVLDRLKLTGEWKVWNGMKQFCFGNAEAYFPHNEKAMLHYICTKAKGFGDKLEGRIWEEYGENYKSLEAGKIPGITQPMVDEFNRAKDEVYLKWEESVQIAGLLNLGLTDNMVTAAWEKWKPDALGVIKSNPYVLTDLPNYGFVKVDNQRGKFGVADDDQRRITAAFLWMAGELTSRGDTVIDGRMLANQTAQLLPQVATEELAKTAKTLIDSGRFVSLGDGYITSAKDFDNELTIWRFANGN